LFHGHSSASGHRRTQPAAGGPERRWRIASTNRVDRQKSQTPKRCPNPKNPRQEKFECLGFNLSFVATQARGSGSPFCLRRRIALAKGGRSTTKTARGGPFRRARAELGHPKISEKNFRHPNVAHRIPNKKSLSVLDSIAWTNRVDRQSQTPPLTCNQSTGCNSCLFVATQARGSGSPFRLRRRIALAKEGRSTAKTGRGGPFRRARAELRHLKISDTQTLLKEPQTKKV